VRPANLSAGRGRLNMGIKDLRLRWDQTIDEWNDAARRDFEENHYGPMEPLVLATLRGLDHLSAIMHEMQRQCGDYEE
jgi:hypothetical protein